MVHQDHIGIFTWLSTQIIVHRLEGSNFSKRVFQFKIKIFVLKKNYIKQLVGVLYPKYRRSPVMAHKSGYDWFRLAASG
jgi:hypothetical protein